MTNIYECPECGGKCEVLEPHLYPTGHREVWVTCEFCEGLGYFEEDEWLVMKLEGKV